MWIKDYIDNATNNTIFSTADVPVYAIGDVHGCADEFEQIVNEIYKVSPTAKIIQLGDLIDRGPHLLRVFEICREYNVDILMGNHELYFWLEVCGEKPCRSSARRETHERFNKLKNKHKDFIIESISSSKNFMKVRSELIYEYFHLTHAPIVMSRYHKNGPALNFCTTSDDRAWDAQNFNIHGHTHWKYISIEEQIEGLKSSKLCSNINLDSGVVYGGCLTALNLSDLSYIQVQAKQTYFQE